MSFYGNRRNVQGSRSGQQWLGTGSQGSSGEQRSDDQTSSGGTETSGSWAVVDHAAPTSEKKLACLWCKEAHACQWLYLLDLGDWQGGVSALCYSCYMESDEGKAKHVSRVQFKELCTGRWTQRKKRAGTHRSVARGVDWKRAVSDVGRRHPGQDKKEWRASVLQTLKVIGKFCQRAYTKMSDHDKRRFVLAFEEQENNLQKIFVPQLHTGVFDPASQAVGTDLSVQGQPMDAMEVDVDTPPPKSLFWATEKVLDWTSQVLEGLDNYYLCRNEACRSFMPNTCWVKQVGHDCYKCPCCLRDYQPWSTSKPTNIKPNKILVGSCEGDIQMAMDMGMNPEEVFMWFVLWVDTPQAILERRMQEISLELAEETRDMSTEELQELVRDKVNATSARTYFEEKNVRREPAGGCEAQWPGRKALGMRALAERLLGGHCPAVH